MAACCAHTDDIHIHPSLESFYLSHDCFRQAHAQHQNKNTSEDADLYGHAFEFNL